REQIDACADVLKPLLGVDLRTVLYPDAAHSEAAQAQLTQTSITQPALFAIEYALAQLWLSWGVTPAALIGHSVGEYVAACIGGTFTRDAALTLLAQRARLMQEMPSGAMLAVRASSDAIAADLGPGLSIAALNAPKLTVVSGDHPLIAELASAMEAKGIASRTLPTSHAFHSAMMDPVVERFTAIVQTVERRAPQLHWISSLTGQPITDAQATDPAYWARQLREPVQFIEGIGQLIDPQLVLLEVGPGQALASLSRQHDKRDASQLVVTSLHPGQDSTADTDYMLAALGQLWARGVSIDWLAVQGGRRRRVPLPTYPFQRQRRWVDPRVSPAATPTLSPVSTPSTTQGSVVTAMTDNRVSQLMPRLQALFADLSGIEVAALDPATGFLELGLDSLFLTQASNALARQFGAKISIRALLDDCSTLNAVAARIVSLMPEQASSPPIAASPASAPASPVAMPMPHLAAPAISADQNALASVFAQQLAVMSQQLDMLSGGASIAATASAPAPTPSAASRMATAAPKRTTTSPAVSPTAAFGPYRPPAKGPTGGLTDKQRDNLAAFIERYNRKTAGSKQATAANRGHLSDPRSVAGFRNVWKEMIYPIVSVRSSGSHLWDVDGNDYVDVTNGFGMILFGHNPPFIRDAIKAQIDIGYEIGPQTPLAGEVSRMICDMIGMERAAFCGTGSEAVTAAIRVARTVSGRDKIVMFAGAYHGIFDEVLVRPTKTSEGLRAMPIAPGVPMAMTDNVLVLDYGAPESLEIIKAMGNEIAAVLVEPVQSRRPDLQPREFLQELRKITAESDTALVFDEVVTGFRVHPGGAQALFGIKADIATYGKVIGGGLPIGVVTGSAKYLDALDGGAWSFGDDSAPEVGVTFFAGTFVRHPLALAAARAVMQRLKQEGPQLQQNLNSRATAFVERLRQCAAELGAPLQINHFSSWFCITFPPDLPLATVFFTNMREKGVHIWDGRPCFLTLAHSDADLDHVATAFRDTLQEMQAWDFLPGAA
ncbi:MAG: aminotransferase class III-fold pyridoxal phosphate-dependent enzyme, partial [Nevskiaceae bacterium]|nr:aminotransferase class III-fold pyridoxal phosphate-dependent enzyme [Nevskiaceae bacterium]